jgi:hypothetical protein
MHHFFTFTNAASETTKAANLTAMQAQDDATVVLLIRCLLSFNSLTNNIRLCREENKKTTLAIGSESKSVDC